MSPFAWLKQLRVSQPQVRFLSKGDLNSMLKIEKNSRLVTVALLEERPYKGHLKWPGKWPELSGSRDVRDLQAFQVFVQEPA